jgi:hypothetical protein
MKIVINICYGGFGLSALATKRLAELQGRECYFFKQEYPNRKYVPISVEEADKAFMFHAWDIPNPDSNSDQHNHFIYYPMSIDRTDPKLIQVVEELGEKANDQNAELKIIEIPDGVDYEIDEYDGVESVHERHNCWS